MHLMIAGGNPDLYFAMIAAARRRLVEIVNPRLDRADRDIAILSTSGLEAKPTNYV